MSILDMLALQGLASSGKSEKSTDFIAQLARFERYLEKKELKKKDKEKKKPEWKFEDRLMMGVCFMFIGPILALISLDVVAHIWANTLDTIQNVKH